MAKLTKLKIALVLDEGLDNPDGVQQYVLSIGEWLTSQGHSVQYLVGQTTRRDIPNLRSLSKNIAVRSNGNQMTIPLPTSRRKLKKLLDEEQFDVLHVQTPYSPFMGGRLIEFAAADCAVIGTFHIAPNSRLISVGNRLLGLWCHRSLQRFDEMLSVSMAAADFALQTFKLDSKVLPNVIDYARFSKAQPLQEYDDDITTILFLGRLVKRKNCLLLIQALYKLHEQGTIGKFRLVICGRGPLETQLRRKVHKLGLGDVTEFVGFVPEEIKPRYYASADLCVFPSSGGESFGIVLLEAMASGRALVLAGNNPGYASVMSPQPDLLFDPADADALTRLIKHYEQDIPLRAQKMRWAQAYAQQFDVNVIGPQLVAVYNKALRKRPRQ
jgi:phosphatidyl-myo-inositol alpha-mannosyltransferase